MITAAAIDVPRARRPGPAIRHPPLAACLARVRLASSAEEVLADR
ncbi:hypothetical protein [Nannocystis pusilla]